MLDNPSDRFLISPAQDFAFIAGSAFIGYAVLALMVFGVVSITPFSLILLFILEAPHIFGTWTRSYLDPEHREKLGWRVLWQIVPLCLVPPLFILAGAQIVFYVLTVFGYIPTLQSSMSAFWRCTNVRLASLTICGSR